MQKQRRPEWVQALSAFLSQEQVMQTNITAWFQQHEELLQQEEMAVRGHRAFNH